MHTPINIIKATIKLCSLSTYPSDVKGGGGGDGCPPLSGVFLNFLLDDKTLAADILNRLSFARI